MAPNKLSSTSMYCQIPPWLFWQSQTVSLVAWPDVQVYQKLLDAGLQPISTTYTALISAFGKAGQLDKAMETFQTMIQQGCERSVITYSALISACEKAGKWEVALDLFEQMQHEGCHPNTVTYNSLITACQQGEKRWFNSAVERQPRHVGCKFHKHKLLQTDMVCVVVSVCRIAVLQQTGMRPACCRS